MPLPVDLAEMYLNSQTPKASTSKTTATPPATRSQAARQAKPPPQPAAQLSKKRATPIPEIPAKHKNCFRKAAPPPTEPLNKLPPKPSPKQPPKQPAKPASKPIKKKLKAGVSMYGCCCATIQLAGLTICRSS